MKVLLVDDQSLYREALDSLLLALESVDITVHAQTGNEALDLFKAQPDIGLVLLDYDLEEGMGVDVLLRIKAFNSEIPVAIISDDDEPAKVQKCLTSGANGYILKKLTSSEIRVVIEKLLEGEMVVPAGVLDQLEGIDMQVKDSLGDAARSMLFSQDMSIRSSDIENGPGGMASAFNQLVDRQVDQQKMEKMAFSDHLTGLYNRRYFFEQLETAFKQQARSYAAFALVYIDIDHFTEVNNAMGEEVGDALLIEIASRIKSETRESDVASRMGGDEFTMILYSVFKEQQVLPYLNRILKVIAKPFVFEDKTIHPSASIGAALSCDYREVKDLIRSADEALYKVKHDGRNGVHVNT
ncbi:putative signaling protein [Thalassocella blandensis]|nr:putative signaling protein [Thalassocella blandensis]